MSVDVYQAKAAAYAAARAGSILDLSCGIGKSITATAAAIAAVQDKKCSNERLFIIAPVNAMAQWEPYMETLKLHYKTVSIISSDSLHLLGGLEFGVGGALIIDELHKFKSLTEKEGKSRENRTVLAHRIRPAFEWCVGLSGTVFLAGSEGVLSMQDLVCPGLSRFTDKYAFGSYFKCMHMQEFAGRHHPKFVSVPAEKHEHYSAYMRRGAYALGYDNEDVKAAFTIPLASTELIWCKDKVQAKYKTLQDYMKVGANIPCSAPKSIIIPAVALALYEQDQALFKEKMAGLSTEEKSFLCDKELVPPPFPNNARVFQAVCKLGTSNQKLKATESSVVYEEGEEGPKLTWLREFLTGYTESVFIGAHYTETLDSIDKLLASLKLKSARIDGSVNSASRKTIVADFQAGNIQVLLGQEIAASESITLTRANVSILVDHSFQPIPYVQFRYRIYRRGQTRETKHYNLVSNEVQNRLVVGLVEGQTFDAEIQRLLEQESGLAELKSNLAH